ncbi:GNAT family N-acetyltransferase [Lachnoclostridium phytofermentans]|uniref:GCN5-related N-acetyltransferase n=1 Tax=Lachnoclostridium phytofermentans (strain ATCC 700394 / DSM 18823 / ISDg) TaxID=357809 RepID=A9KL96_LACP7|nr:GNAT family N-acetyltransferase [Lachnoclostridium phytofermentans]ABX44245.1 GCN5-related N-acetyltransferase [Lachnoclostridium phytofermentans ISDg]
MKVKFLCRLLNRHKQQINNLLTLDSEDRLREDMVAGTQVYEEFGLPPFALLYEGELVVGFFALLCVEEDSDGELVAEGRFYIRGNEKNYAEYLIQSIKEEYEELKHLSVLSDEEAPFLSGYHHYAEHFMRLSGEGSNQISNFSNHKFYERNEEKDRTSFLIDPIDKNREEEIQFYLDTLKDIFSMSDEVATEHLTECLEDSDFKLYVVKIDKKIVGTCGAYIGTKSDTIFDIAISKTEQGKGYGRLLLAKFLDMLNSPLKDIILQVSTKSEAAFHLYEEFGFQIEQKLLFYVVW